MTVIHVTNKYDDEQKEQDEEDDEDDGDGGGGGDDDDDDNDNDDDRPGGSLQLLSARPAVTFPATDPYRPLATTKL